MKQENRTQESRDAHMPRRRRQAARRPGKSSWLQVVQRTAHGQARPVEHMGIDHGGGDIGMAKQLLLNQTCGPSRSFHGLLSGRRPVIFAVMFLLNIFMAGSPTNITQRSPLHAENFECTRIHRIGTNPVWLCQWLQDILQAGTGRIPWHPLKSLQLVGLRRLQQPRLLSMRNLEILR